jgi:hypothetical protein
MTSRHATDGGRRGIAPWIIVTVIATVVVVAATVGYLLIVRSDDNESAAANCTSHVTLPVAAGPGALPAISEAATAFDATNPVARSACLTTRVSAVPDSSTASTPVEQWKQEPDLAPAMWVTDSEAELLAVEATDSGLTAGRDTEPIAFSPVVLAVRSADDAAAAAVSWADLPEQTGPDGSITLPDGRRVILALPDPSANRATSYALQSVVSAGSPTGVPVDAAAVSAAGAELAALGLQDPASRQSTTLDALRQLAAGNATFTAVPVVESDLIDFSATTPGLVAVAPAGAAVGDAVWPVPLTASWVTPTLKDAAARFAAYLRSPAGGAAFTASGLRLTDDAPAASSASGASKEPTSASGPSSEPTSASGAAGQTSIPDAGGEVADALATAINGSG